MSARSIPRVVVRGKVVMLRFKAKSLWSAVNEKETLVCPDMTTRQALSLAVALCEALAPMKKKAPAPRGRGRKCEGECRRCCGGGCGR